MEDNGGKILVGINTKGTKFYLVRTAGPIRMVKAEPSQALPEELKGGFTDAVMAAKAFDMYMARVNRKPKGGEKPGDAEE